MQRLLKAITPALIIALVLCQTAAAAGEPFSYSNQQAWPNICVAGNTGRQSPIDIITADVEESDSLSALVFGDGWADTVDGTFGNGGHNLQFTPDPSAEKPQTTTPSGTYELAQFHLHWGMNDEEGSEHLINGKQYELEIHFVHTMKDSTDTTAGDYLAVIGVFANAVDEPINGVWQQLDASQSNQYDTFIDVTGLNYNDLLPAVDNRGYFFYIGSLTTPPCNETVQWYVLKESINFPRSYLNYLRQATDANNATLSLNFREPQAIGNRVVMTLQSGGTKLQVSTLVILCSAILAVYVKIFL